MMKLLVKCMMVFMLLGVLTSATTKAAHAYNWSSSDKWATWSNGGYWVQNDIWGSNPGPQTIYANSFSNWWVTCTHSGSGIKSYPAVGKNIGKSVNSLGSLTSWFSASTPGGSAYDLAYDIWLNGSSYEVMIWSQWSGTQPIAASYDQYGNAVPAYTNQNIGGTTYNVYKRGSVYSFLRTSQSSSTWTDIRSVLQWINSKGWYNNPTVTDVQFGWEIINTGGVQRTFTLNNYYVDFS